MSIEDVPLVPVGDSQPHLGEAEIIIKAKYRNTVYIGHTFEGSLKLDLGDIKDGVLDLNDFIDLRDAEITITPTMRPRVQEL